MSQDKTPKIDIHILKELIKVKRFNGHEPIHITDTHLWLEGQGLISIQVASTVRRNSRYGHPGRMLLTHKGKATLKAYNAQYRSLFR